MDTLINYIIAILLNSLLLTFVWQQNENAQSPNITQLQIFEYNTMQHGHTTFEIDVREDLEFIASRDSSQPLLGAVILKNDQEHNASRVYENFIFTDGQQLDKKSHYMMRRLGYQLIQPYNAPPVHTLLQWLAQNPEKKIHALAFNYPICPAWYYLLTIIYPERDIELDEQSCDLQSLTCPLTPLIMQYLNRRIMQSSKPLEEAQKILYFFSINAENQLNDLKEENQILQNKLHQTTKALTYVPTQVLYDHTGEVNSVVYSPNGQLLVSSGEDKRVYIYDAQSYKLVKKLEDHTSGVLRVTFSPDNKLLVTACWDKTVRIYNIDNYQLYKELKDYADWVNDLAFSPDGQYLATASNPKTIHIYTKHGYFLKKLEEHTKRISSIVFSPKNKHFVSGSRDGSIRIYNTTTFELIRKLETHNSVLKVVFSPDEKYLIASTKIGFYIYDATNYQVLQVINDKKEDYSFSLAFSPNSQLLAAGSKSGNVYLYNITTYQLFKTLQGHTENAWSLAFSPNGTLASASFDKTVRIWELITSS